MPLQVNLEDLMAYTEWERDQWHAWFGKTGAGALAVGVGPHGDGRFSTVGELVRHIFSAETRYIERLRNRPITDTASIPAGEVEPLFGFGQQSRQALRAFCAEFPEQAWEVPVLLTLGQLSVTATPRKILLHVLLHEMKHWAQVATLLRLQGLTGGFRDLLFSPILGGGASAPKDRG